jgi:hypothetical protein
MSSQQDGGSKTYAFATDDPALQRFLDDADNRSELLREGAKRMAWERDELEIETPELSERERTAYGWLTSYAAGDSLKLEIVKTKLAQELQIEKDLVKADILIPIQNAGYIDVTPTIHDVKVRPRRPEEVSTDG